MFGQSALRTAISLRYTYADRTKVSDRLADKYCLALPTKLLHTFGDTAAGTSADSPRADDEDTNGDDSGGPDDGGTPGGLSDR